MEIRTVHANGLEFAYLAVGDGPLAMCLHGFPDTAHTWRHLMPALAARGYRAVAPFMRGYAPTEATDVVEPGALVADAAALHEALGGDEQAVVIGHDWGTVPVYATTGRFRRSVALAVPPPNAGVLGRLDYEQLKRSFYAFLFQTGLGAAAVAQPEFIAGLWRDWSPGYDAEDDLAFVAASLAGPANRAAAIGYYRAMFGTAEPTGRYVAEQAAVFEGPVGPVLYLHGEKDGCLASALVQDVKLPEGSRMVTVADAGHFLHLERPEEVNALVLDWLE
ncbi:alpha/beta hydrolase [Nonomuraea longicatena]|uniref:Alpha/beta hydrolase n=1 Tax=Nonomuraea longicatena TaxID=83682 RepID=A0ABP3Z3E1_9ACTN